MSEKSITTCRQIEQKFDKSQIRSSNIELLRILTMLMIVAFHIVVHCIKTQITSADSIARMGNGVFNNPVIYKKLFILYAIIPFGRIGVTIFVLISGYFLVKKGNQVNILKTAKNLLLQLGFATFVLVFASAFLYRCVGRDQYIGMRMVTHFNTGSWFVGYYFLLILFGFVFLNNYLIGLSRNNYLTFLIVFLHCLNCLGQGKWQRIWQPELGSYYVGYFYTHSADISAAINHLTSIEFGSSF